MVVRSGEAPSGGLAGIAKKLAEKGAKDAAKVDLGELARASTPKEPAPKAAVPAQAKEVEQAGNGHRTGDEPSVAQEAGEKPEVTKTEAAPELTEAQRSEWGGRLLDPVLSAALETGQNEGNASLIALYRIGRGQSSMDPQTGERDAAFRYHARDASGRRINQPAKSLLVESYDTTDPRKITLLDASTGSRTTVNITEHDQQFVRQLWTEALDQGITFADPKHEEFVRAYLTRGGAKELYRFTPDGVDSAKAIELARGFDYRTADDIRTLIDTDQTYLVSDNNPGLQVDPLSSQDALRERERLQALQRTQAPARREIDQILDENYLLGPKELTKAMELLRIPGRSSEALANHISSLEAHERELARVVDKREWGERDPETAKQELVDTRVSLDLSREFQDHFTAVFGDAKGRWNLADVMYGQIEAGGLPDNTPSSVLNAMASGDPVRALDQLMPEQKVTDPKKLKALQTGKRKLIDRAATIKKWRSRGLKGIALVGGLGGLMMLVGTRQEE